MPTHQVAEEEIRVGEPVVIEGESPGHPFVAVFEDDGETGYFYALDTNRADENQIVDALHIYDVEGVTDRHIPSTIRIVWSTDGRSAACYSEVAELAGGGIDGVVEGVRRAVSRVAAEISRTLGELDTGQVAACSPRRGQ